MIEFVIDFLAVVFLNAIFINGIKWAMNDGMILDLIPKILDKAPEIIRKPIFECLKCMASFWGLIFLGAFYIVDGWIFSPCLIVIYIPVLSVMNLVVDYLITWLYQKCEL